MIFAVLRRFFAAFAAFIFIALSVGLTAFCVDDQIVITMPNMDVEYTPEGFVPKADAGNYQSRVQYSVTDAISGEKVDIPVKKVGRFTVHAYIERGNANYLASCTATLLVRKAQVYVEVTNPVVAHTAMDNPVRYTVGPEWAQEYVTISLEYKSIKNISDAGVPCGIPKAPGLYLAYFQGEVSSENIEFSGKYLIYEIAEKDGSAVTTDEARRSVPNFVRASVRSVTTPYNGKAVVPEYSINTAFVNSRLMYGRAYANGSVGVFSETVPVEPGDYVVNCYVLNTVVGSGRLIIEKIKPDIKLKDITIAYTPQGYNTNVIGADTDIALTFSAYEYKDGKAGDGVEFPIKQCGTYLIAAYPEDTAHYVYDVAYCTLTIRPIQSAIKGENKVYTADGTAKPAVVTVAPEYADFDISYYSVSGGETTAIDGAPKNAGEYFAVVAVKGSDSVLSSTAVYGIYIQPEPKLFSVGMFFEYLCIGVSLTVLGVGITELISVKRRKGEK